MFRVPKAFAGPKATRLGSGWAVKSRPGGMFDSGAFERVTQ
jgi:hypothetical protein